MATYSTSKKLIKAYHGKIRSRMYLSFGILDDTHKRVRVQYLPTIKGSSHFMLMLT